MYKKLTTWSHAHTLVTIVVVGGVGYFLYNKYKKTYATGGTTEFTGGKDSYLNADAKTVVVDINRPYPPPAPPPVPKGTVIVKGGN